MEETKEANLKLFCADVLKLITSQKKNTCKSNLSLAITTTRKYLKQNELTLAHTDKTNKLCMMSKNDLISETEKILQDTSTYKPIEKSACEKLEKQANKILKTLNLKFG